MIQNLIDADHLSKNEKVSRPSKNSSKAKNFDYFLLKKIGKTYTNTRFNPLITIATREPTINCVKKVHMCVGKSFGNRDANRISLVCNWETYLTLFRTKKTPTLPHPKSQLEGYCMVTAE